jgi:uncharacterized protein (TIGR03435 family)
MGRIFTGIGIAAFLCSEVFGQSSEPRPAFEMADVHVSPHSAFPQMTGGVLRAGRYELRKASMVDLIRTAYGIDADSVVGGPSWLESDRFDVIAKAPPDTPAETTKLMLQSLLADRFKLVVHNETRPMPAFVLTAGKGKPKLKESEGGDGRCQFQQQNNQPDVPPTPMVHCRHVSMDAFARVHPR